MEVQTQNQNAENGWVRVSNLSPRTTKEELLNLFGFCGFVNGITFQREQCIEAGGVPGEDKLVAIVEFYDKNAVTTACLLSSAVIQGQPIQVELYIANNEEQQALSTSDTKTSQTPPPVSGDPASKQSKTAVTARLLASGYLLATDVKTKAIAWDSGNLTIIQKLEALGTVALQQAGEINDRYHLTEKKDEFVAAAEKKGLEIKSAVEANPNFQQAKGKVLEIDSKYGISTKVLSVFESTKMKVQELKDATNVEVEKQKAAQLLLPPAQQQQQLPAPQQQPLQQQPLQQQTQPQPPVQGNE